MPMDFDKKSPSLTQEEILYPNVLSLHIYSFILEIKNDSNHSKASEIPEVLNFIALFFPKSCRW